jgi:hypothetical protein
MSTLKVDTILKRTGTGTISIGQSGDTISIPSGATLNSAGTNTLEGINNTPSFSAKLSGDQTISNGSYTKISFATEEWDTDSTYDTSSYRWTPALIGKYNVKILIMWNNVTAQNQKLQLAIYKNGSFYADVENIGSSASGADPTLMINLDLSLSATDYVEAYAYQSTGGGIEIVANYSWFQGNRILGA